MREPKLFNTVCGLILDKEGLSYGTGAKFPCETCQHNPKNDVVSKRCADCLKLSDADCGKCAQSGKQPDTCKWEKKVK